ncbi:MAG: hypothetical protein IIA87_02825 [Nanoarchaeota archaeon]|nr:hypothetical protein [Nanoarchaeota archaeon]
MVKRKKRPKKGIKSLERQIELHEEKLRKTIEEGNIYLEKYYGKEIASQEKAKKKKEEKSRRKGKRS